MIFSFNINFNMLLGKEFVRHKELIKNQYVVIQVVNGNLNEDM